MKKTTTSKWIKYFAAISPAIDHYGGLPSFLRVIFNRAFFHGYEGIKKLMAPFLTGANAWSNSSSPSTASRPAEIKYVIWAPNYGENSAGVRCLYQLCDRLNELGYNSVIAHSKLGPDHLNAPIVSSSYAKLAVSSGAVAVYPESISGNPLNASRIARWVLNKPGWISGDKVFDDREFIFYYAEGFKSSIQNKISGKLFMPPFDESLFFDDAVPVQKRNLACYYVGKSKFKENVLDIASTFEITRQYPHRTELGKLLRGTKVLYCFDNSTSLVFEAVMCGCPVVIIPDGTQTRKDYENSEMGMAGIAWGIEELNQTVPNPQEMKTKYAQLKAEFEQQLKEFVKITLN